MSAIWAIARTDLRRLFRKPMLLFWVLGYPVLVGVLFGLAFSGIGKPRGQLPIVVAVADGSQKAQEFLKLLAQENSLKVTVGDPQSARESVRVGKAIAYVLVKEGFGQVRPFMPEEKPLLELGLDPARKAEAGLVEGLITKAYFSLMFRHMQQPANLLEASQKLKEELPALPEPLHGPLGTLAESLEKLAAAIQLRPEVSWEEANPFTKPPFERVEITGDRKRPPNAFAITVPQASAWALISVVMSFSLTLVRERTDGTWLRLRLAPLTSYQVVFGKVTACFLTAFGALALVLAIGVGLGVQPHNWLLLLLVGLCTAFCFSGLTMLLGSLGKSEEEASGWGWAVMLILGMLGGAMIPLAFMPPWMRLLAQGSPLRWAVFALEAATWRGTSWEQVWPLLVLLSGCGLVSLVYAGKRLSQQV
ncbi:MAG: ABC transporter permease [Thermoanaerobaculaceae bacterium]